MCLSDELQQSYSLASTKAAAHGRRRISSMSLIWYRECRTSRMVTNSPARFYEGLLAREGNGGGFLTIAGTAI